MILICLVSSGMLQVKSSPIYDGYRPLCYCYDGYRPLYVTFMMYTYLYVTVMMYTDLYVTVMMDPDIYVTVMMYTDLYVTVMMDTDLYVTVMMDTDRYMLVMMYTDIYVSVMMDPDLYVTVMIITDLYVTVMMYTYVYVTVMMDPNVYVTVMMYTDLYVTVMIDPDIYVTVMIDTDLYVTGMMRYMSCRNQLTLLQCLLESYQTATLFDQRPGLKFLIQKVARAEVAANMYKQAGVSLTFYIHTLLEIVAHQDNICVENTKNMLCADKGLPSISGQGEEEGVSMNSVSSGGPVQMFVPVFVNKMKEIFDEVCTNYVDMYLDQEGPNLADRLSGQMLVFLLAQPEELPSLKRDKSLKEMVAEKLRKAKSPTKEPAPCGVGVYGSELEQPLTMGLLPLQPMSIQGTFLSINIFVVFRLDQYNDYSPSSTSINFMTCIDNINLISIWFLDI